MQQQFNAPQLRMYISISYNISWEIPATWKYILYHLVLIPFRGEVGKFVKWVHDSCCNSRAFCACAGPKNCTNTSPSISWESSRICISPTGMEAKKHIGDDDAIHNTSWWVTQRFRNMPGVYIMLSHVWEEFDLFCMTSTNAERLPCFIWIPHLSVPSSKSQILANTTIFVDSPTPPNQNCQLFLLGTIVMIAATHPQSFS